MKAAKVSTIIASIVLSIVAIFIVAPFKSTKKRQKIQKVPVEQNRDTDSMFI